MNRTDRLVAIVMVMQGRRLVRAEDLANQFEVSVRTIYRDIDGLCEAGVPITGEAGVGYSLVKGYHLPPVMLTADEASALFIGAELARKLTDASVTGPITQALDKLRAVLPRERKQQIETLGRRTMIFSRRHRPFPGEADAGGLLCVQEAVVAQRILKLTYKARGKEEATVRPVEPLGIIFADGAWTLVAWCRLRKDYRHFRIDRMARIEVQPETFPTRQEFNLAVHVDSMEMPEKTQPARIWFAKRALDRAHRESTATLIPEKQRDNGADFTVYTFSLEWLALWLLSFGPDAEALEPPSLREHLCREADAVSARHRDRN